MISDKEIRTAIWKERLPSVKGTLVVVALVSFIVFLILYITPVGPTREIAAQVETIGVRHDETGSEVYLVCILDNGNRVNVFNKSFNKPVRLVQKGQMVKLRELSYLLFGRKTYQFVSFDYPKVDTQVK